MGEELVGAMMSAIISVTFSGVPLQPNQPVIMRNSESVAGTVNIVSCEFGSEVQMSTTYLQDSRDPKLNTD